MRTPSARPGSRWPGGSWREGVASRYDGLPVREISLVTLAVDRPDPVDEIIARHAEPERLAWMHANFTDHAKVDALGGADSYATRLFDYEHSGRDQVAWVVDRLRQDPATRSAAITTFQPHTDTSLHPLRQPARLLAAGRRGRADRLRAQHRLRRQGLRQPGRARLAAAARGRPARPPGRAAADDGQVGARVRDRTRPTCRGYSARPRAREPYWSVRARAAGRGRPPWPAAGLASGPGPGLRRDPEDGRAAHQVVRPDRDPRGTGRRRSTPISVLPPIREKPPTSSSMESGM